MSFHDLYIPVATLCIDDGKYFAPFNLGSTSSSVGVQQLFNGFI